MKLGLGRAFFMVEKLKRGNELLIVFTLYSKKPVNKPCLV